MKLRLYNLIYAVYVHFFGRNNRYEKAKEIEYNAYAIEMMDKILDLLQIYKEKKKNK